MWWLIFAAPAALVAYELLDEDRRAAWVKRWAEVNAHTCEFGEHCGRLRCRGPRRAGGYRARESVDPRTVRPPRSPTAVTPPRPRPGLDTIELQDGLNRRQAQRQAGFRTVLGCGCGSCVRGTACENSLLTAMARSRSALAKEGQCYTCELLDRDDAGPHEHPFEDLVAAERVERDLRHPRRSKALWELVNHARATAKDYTR